MAGLELGFVSADSGEAGATGFATNFVDGAVDCDWPLDHSAKVTPATIKMATAPPASHQTTAVAPLDAVSNSTGIASSTGAATGAGSSGTSNAKSVGTMVLADVDMASAGSAVEGETTDVSGLDWGSIELPTFHPAGGTIATMLPHLGQAWICPMASGSRTFSRERHVSHITRKGSTTAMTTFRNYRLTGGIRGQRLTSKTE